VLALMCRRRAAPRLGGSGTCVGGSGEMGVRVFGPAGRLVAGVAVAVVLAGCHDSGGGGSSGGGGGGGGGGALGGQGGGGGGGGRPGVPSEITLPELDRDSLRAAVERVCGSPDGAPGCLTVEYVGSGDPTAPGCSFSWHATPRETFGDDPSSATVARGATIVGTTTCDTDSGTPTDSPSTDDSGDDGSQGSAEPSPSETG
jgi:hypothetical protein